MAQDFINKTVDAALAEKIRSATSTAEIRELCVASGEQVGILVRDRSGEVSVRKEFVVPQSAPKPEPQADELMKRAVRLPDNSIQLITAYSTSGLDTLQRALRAEEVKFHK